MKPILAQRKTSPKPAEEEKTRIILIGYNSNYFYPIMRRQFLTLGRKFAGDFLGLRKVGDSRKDKDKS